MKISNLFKSVIILTAALFSLLYLFTDDPICAQKFKNPLRFGHISVEDPTVTLNKYQPLLDIISKEIGRKVILVQTSSYSKMNEAFLKKNVDMGILNSFSYVQIADKAGLVPLARRVIKGRGSYRSYIIVRNNEDINKYADIKGKIFAFSDPNSTTGYLLPKIMLAKNGIDHKEDLNKTLFIGKHDSTIYAVLNKTADAGAIASYIFDAADVKIKARIKILGKSEPIPLGPMVIRQDLGKELAEKIKKTMLGLYQNKKGMNVLKSAKLNRFEQASDKDYDIVREMAGLLRK